jgi:hypothetical protein
LISLYENQAVRKYGNTEPESPCLFILGPPRSGSTIIYQLLTALLDVAYIDNLSNLAWENPFTGFQISRLFLRDRPHSSFRSQYGQTSQDGLHAPAEALFPYKWFPKGKHYTELDDLDETRIRDFRKTIFSILNVAKKPLVIKNLSFSLRLQVLRAILPDSRYIVVRREPLFTAQSLLLTMRTNPPESGKVWGILPKDYEKISGLEPHELVVRQIYMIEEQIIDDLKQVDQGKVLYIDYEDLESGLNPILEEVRSLLGIETQTDRGMPVPAFHARNEVRISGHDLKLIQEQIQKLDWKLHNRRDYGKS